MTEESMYFEQRLVDFLKSLRQRIASNTTSTGIIFQIRASGRVNEGEMEVTFSLENNYDSKADVSGGDLEQVVVEYMRRFDWQKANQPLCLPNVASPVAASDDDEMPF